MNSRITIHYSITLYEILLDPKSYRQTSLTNEADRVNQQASLVIFP